MVSRSPSCKKKSARGSPLAGCPGRDGHRRRGLGDHGRHGRLHDPEQPAAIEQPARTDGLKNEVVIQRPTVRLRASDALDRRQARVGRDARRAGRSDQARTAMMFLLNRTSRWTRSSGRSGSASARRAIRYSTTRPRTAAGRPVFRVPDQGFDLVAFSGGKGMEVRKLGIVLGRPDLIAAGRRAMSPDTGFGRDHEGRQGRDRGPAGGRRAVLERDRDADAASGKTRFRMISCSRRSRLNAGTTSRVRQSAPHRLLNGAGGTAHRGRGCRANAVGRRTTDRRWRKGARLRVAVWTLRDDEHRIVAKRIRDIFNKIKS